MSYRPSGGTIHQAVISMRTESIVYQVPSLWLPGLINHDYSGLELEDSRQLTAFAQGEIGGMRKQNRSLIGIDCAEESYFQTYHDGRPYGCLACDVTDCEFVFRID
jgi:hypothetical protein